MNHLFNLDNKVKMKLCFTIGEPIVVLHITIPGIVDEVMSFASQHHTILTSVTDVTTCLNGNTQDQNKHPLFKKKIQRCQA